MTRSDVRCRAGARWGVLAIGLLAGVGLGVGLGPVDAVGGPPVEGMVKGVEIVAAPGSPGTLVAMNRSAVPVVMG
ncbi:MAG: hypothetical protein MUE97_03120, partial [Phycisphaerales bacterium]|nr:hypothetical protein [Phycisphaerales bacterium]